MMRPISYFTTCELWLSLEDYWNAGLSRERAKEIIERMPDPGSATLNLRCRDSHINDNWNVHTSATSPYLHEDIVYRIQAALDEELARMAASKTPSDPLDRNLEDFLNDPFGDC